MLSNVQVVLVETSHPGNIGAVARAMKNMGLSRLVLVSPRDFPSDEATVRASGADDILASAVVCNSLDDALKESSFIVGASARIRTLRWPQLEPRDCAQKVLENAGSGNVSLVFGRERNGLTNEELERCHYLVHIPTNEEYMSLNLAAAVQVIAYEVHLANRDWDKPEYSDSEGQVVPAKDMLGFYDHFERVLVKTDFLDPENPKHLMRRLKRLFNRARPDRRELNILRGILTQVEKSVNEKEK